MFTFFFIYKFEPGFFFVGSFLAEFNELLWCSHTYSRIKSYAKSYVPISLLDSSKDYSHPIVSWVDVRL